MVFGVKLWMLMCVTVRNLQGSISLESLDGSKVLEDMPKDQQNANDRFEIYERFIKHMHTGSNFIEAVAKVGYLSWSKFLSILPGNFELPVWLHKQCNATGDEVMRCSCFELMNMGDQWLKHSRVSGEEYRQLRRRAAKLHHRDTGGGSDAPLRFLIQCSTLLCGDEKCMTPDRLHKPATDFDRAAKSRRAEYIKDMKKIWSKCERRASKVGTENAAGCYAEEVEELNYQTFSSERPRARTDTRSQRSNAQRGHEEQLLVFLDNSYSMKGANLAKAKQLLKLLFPRFEKTPTSIHLIGGSATNSQSSVFKERVEDNAGLYENTMIRATLIWNNCNDIDLHLYEPDGTHIYHGAKKSTTGGELDIDRNVGSSCVARPVENIRWEIGNSQPPHGHYTVKVNHYSHDHRSSVTTPLQIEVAVGTDVKHFDLTLISVGQTETVFEFDFSGGFGAQPEHGQSRELFPNTTDFTLNDVDAFWQADAWSTHLWEYIYEQLRSAAGGSAMTDWDVLIVTDGIDNDSPGSFLGPLGFNEMMNRLQKHGMFPRVNVYCIGKEHCTGDASGAHHYRDLVLARGGVFFADVGVGGGRGMVEFASRFTASKDERVDIARESQEQWLQLVEDGVPVSNIHEQYTKELLAFGTRGDALLKKSSHADDGAPEIQCHNHGSAKRCTFS